METSFFTYVHYLLVHMRKFPLWLLLFLPNKFSCQSNRRKRNINHPEPIPISIPIPILSNQNGKGKMAYRPSFYLEIGRKARDLLYRDYTEQPPMHYHYGCCDWSYDLALRSQICRSTSHEINDNNQELVGEHVPGISAVLRFIVPDPLSSKVELRYLRDFLGITAGIEGMTTNPVMSFSGVIGSSVVSLGTDLAFDTILKNFTKCNAGLSFSSPIVSASLTLEDKGDTAKASCFGLINPLTSTAIAAELKHTFSQNETSLTLGAQHEVAPLTVIKARGDTTGKVGALFQHQLVSKIFLTLAGDVDIKELKTSPTIGLSLALRP